MPSSSVLNNIFDHGEQRKRRRSKSPTSKKVSSTSSSSLLLSSSSIRGGASSQHRDKSKSLSSNVGVSQQNNQSKKANNRKSLGELQKRRRKLVDFSISERPENKRRQQQQQNDATDMELDFINGNKVSRPMETINQSMPATTTKLFADNNAAVHPLWLLLTPILYQFHFEQESHMDLQSKYDELEKKYKKTKERFNRYRSVYENQKEKLDLMEQQRLEQQLLFQKQLQQRMDFRQQPPEIDMAETQQSILDSCSLSVLNDNGPTNLFLLRETGPNHGTTTTTATPKSSSNGGLENNKNSPESRQVAEPETTQEEFDGDEEDNNICGQETTKINKYSNKSNIRTYNKSATRTPQQQKATYPASSSPSFDPAKRATNSSNNDNNKMQSRDNETRVNFGAKEATSSQFVFKNKQTNKNNDDDNNQEQKKRDVIAQTSSTEIDTTSSPDKQKSCGIVDETQTAWDGEIMQLNYNDGDGKMAEPDKRRVTMDTPSIASLKTVKQRNPFGPSPFRRHDESQLTEVSDVGQSANLLETIGTSSAAATKTRTPSPVKRLFSTIPIIAKTATFGDKIDEDNDTTIPTQCYPVSATRDASPKEVPTNEAATPRRRQHRSPYANKPNRNFGNKENEPQTAATPPTPADEIISTPPNNKTEKGWISNRPARSFVAEIGKPNKSRTASSPKRSPPSTTTTAQSNDSMPDNVSSSDLNAVTNIDDKTNDHKEKSTRKAVRPSSSPPAAVTTSNVTTRKKTTSRTASKATAAVAVASKKKKATKFRYQETVRNKREREGMKTHECAGCGKFLDAVMEGDGSKIFKRHELMCTSRHRTRHTPPKTPDEFWDLSFADEKQRKKGRSGAI